MIIYLLAAVVAGFVTMFASSNDAMFMVGFIIFIFGGVCSDFLENRNLHDLALESKSDHGGES